jgi:hypothetical protein
MRALASFQDLYVGLEPYRNNELLGGGVLKSTAPAVFGLLAAIELHPSNSKSGGEIHYLFEFMWIDAPFFCSTLILILDSVCTQRRLSCRVQRS